MIGTVPNVLVVHPSVPAGSLAEFVAYAKANPSKVSVATAGIGTSQHISLELINSMAALRLVHVPYKGGSLAMTDLLGGQVPAMISGLPSALQTLATPEVQQRLAEQGYEVVTTTPAELAVYIRTEIPKWAKVVKEAGITPE